MTQLFNASDYATIHSLVFRDDYPGYKPNVVESPNGDGKLDSLKRYAHVAEKYLAPKGPDTYGEDVYFTHHERDFCLSQYLDRAHLLSLEVAISIGVPREFWPVRKYGALRVLEYGPDAVTNPHTDFDLFTLMCYRNLPEYFKYLDNQAKDAHVIGSRKRADTLKTAQKLNAQVHFGELLELLDQQDPSNKVWKATNHEVVASGGPSQFSIVYFSIPDHGAVLPNGVTVEDWLQERLSRSRYAR